MQEHRYSAKGKRETGGRSGRPSRWSLSFSAGLYASYGPPAWIASSSGASVGNFDFAAAGVEMDRLVAARG